MPRSSAAPTGSLKLRLHLSREGRGSEPDSKARFSAPPLNPSLWPREEGYCPMACLGHLPAPAPFPPSRLRPPTASSLRYRDSVQGLEGPGWTPAHGLTSGLGKLLAFLAGHFAALSILILFSFFPFLVPSLLPPLFFLVLAENGMTSCQSNDSSSSPLHCGRQRRGAFQMTRCNLIFPSPSPPRTEETAMQGV